MSNPWVRLNGQAELRDNLRTAMRESGRSQRDITDEAGIRYTHVVGGLGNNNWITVEAVEAIAAVLEIAPEEPLGESIYKHERERYAEFDTPPPEIQAEREKKAARRAAHDAAVTGPDPTRALCCVCASLRTASYAGHEFDPEWQPRNVGRRTVDLFCFFCDEVTVHGVLLGADSSDRDAAEIADRAPTRAQEAQQERDALVARLAGFNVDVHYRSRREKSRREGYLLLYTWDKAKSRWRIEVDPNAPARVQLHAIDRAWDHIAHDTHNVDWDPRDGVQTRFGADVWETAADDLIEDAQRFLDVERRKLARDVHDRAALADAESRRDEEADR